MKKKFNKPVDNFDDESSHVDRAWASMRKVLDEQMPVKRNDRSRRSIIYYTAAAAWLLFLLVALILGKTFSVDEHPEISANADRTDIAAAQKTAIKSNDVFLKGSDNEDSYDHLHPSTSFQSLINKAGNKKLIERVMLQGESYNPDKGTSSRRTSFSSTDVRPEVGNEINFRVERANKILMLQPTQFLAEMNAISPETKQKLVIHPPPVRDTLATSFHPTTIADHKDKHLKKVGFGIGVYHNFSGSNRTIFPMISVIKRLNNKLSLSSGLGFNSQMNVANLAPKEFIVINDTLNQVYFSVAQKHISKAVYLDLPLAMNYRVTRNISVHAGIQLSLLQHTDENAEEKTFDFQSNLSQQVSAQINTTTGSYNPNQRYTQDYTFFKSNGRFIAGIGYEFKAVGVNLQYAKSFSPNYSVRDFDGTELKKKLSVFTIGLHYRIR